MKNNSTITLTFLFCFLFFTNALIGQCPDSNALICDDFEGYTLTDISAQSPNWTPWSGMDGAADDAVVSDAMANGGTQSLLISEANGDDMLLLLGDQTSGTWKLSWDMYVPSGNSGYFNIQKIEADPGGEYGLQAFFNTDGTATIDAGVESAVTYNFTHDSWVKIVLIVDLDNDWITYSVDGAEIYSFPASYGSFATTGLAQLGSVNIYGWVGTLQYIDNVKFNEIPTCSSDAVICENFETYLDGSTTGGQAPWWTTWTGTWGTTEDGTVSTLQAASGDNSMLIREGQSQDVLLLLGDRTFGQYNLRWKTYVPAGATGYYNIQEEEEPGVAWNMELWYNEGGTQAGTGTTTLSATTFTYPEDTWFDVEHYIDLDADTMTLWIDGAMVETYTYTGNLGAIDFFSVDATNRYFIDDIVYEDLTVINCDNFSSGTATGTSNICFGDTTSFEVIDVYIPADTVNGFNWIVSSEDVSGSMDPYNEASLLGTFALSEEVYTPALVNDGTQLPSGTYYFTAVSFGGAIDTDGTFAGLDFTNGCVETGNSIEVFLEPDYAALSASTSSVDEVTPPGMNGEASVTVSGGSGTYSVEWSDGSETETITGLAAGDYTVTITDESGCVADLIQTVTVNMTTGTYDLALEEAIQLYPNPAKQFATLAYHFEEAKDLQLKLYNNLGQLVLSNQIDNVTAGHVELDLKQFASGIYFLNVSDKSGSVIEKLVIE